MSITTDSLRIAVERAHVRMATLEPVLNAADAQLGDGDTGAMLARLVAAYDAVEPDRAAGSGAYLTALAKAGAASTGSSLGTLVTTAMLTAARFAGTDSELGADRLGALFAAVRDAVMARGWAELGAKTIVDGLDALACALDGIEDPAAVPAAAVAAVDQALAAFRPLPARMGRAGMFADKSVGLDDPGMLALAEITRAVAGHG